jgi:alkanesulfonate monooxygenase SsuD/methylene tetrahydromethanopterin reductase-like flavin-dependent oxidoreductase (luciferase family)
VGRDPADINKTRLGTLFAGETYDAALDKVRAAVRERGMDWDALDDTAKASFAFLIGGPDEIAGEVKALLDAGLDGLIFNMLDSHNPEAVELAGSILKPLLP